MNIPLGPPAFQSLEGRSRSAITAAWAEVVVCAIAVVSCLLQAELLSRSFGMDEATANDNRQRLVGFAQIAVAIVALVLFLRWVYLAHKNLAALHASELSCTSGWAVGYFFIPIIGLYRPYQIIKEIYQASDPDVATSDTVARRATPSNSLIGWWWALMIIGSVVGRVTMQMSMGAHSVSELQTATWTIIFSDILSIVECVVTISMIRLLTERQDAKRMRLAQLAANPHSPAHLHS